MVNKENLEMCCECKQAPADKTGLCEACQEDLLTEVYPPYYMEPARDEGQVEPAFR
jgi:hypothetical protein